MKSSHNSIVTPGKLLNPFSNFIQPRYYKSIHSYLKEPKVQRKLYKPLLPGLTQNSETRETIMINLPEYSSMKMSKTSLKQRNSRLNRSCKAHKSIDLSSSNVKDKFEIPQLSYKTFEKFRLPSVKVKVQLKTFSPKQLPVIVREKSKESTPEPVIAGPTRVEITEHSKEYSSRIHRVHEIAKIVKLEHSE